MDDDESTPPLTVDVLADLQAGLFDDHTAARLRRRIRTDPEAQQTMAALNRVRRDVAALGPDPGPRAGTDPADLIDVGARSETSAAHAVERGRFPRPARITLAAAGLAAVAVAAWLGVSGLLTEPAPMPSRPTTIEHITVTRPAPAIPLSDQQIRTLLDQTHDLGPLGDGRRLASCLAGLGYPANAPVLGARPVDVDGHPAVLLVLPGPTPGALAALAVAPTCSSANTGLSADRTVSPP